MVKVSYGVHNLEAAIAGKSVSEVRQSLKEPLNIDPRALALVNSRDVAASYILKQGDQLEFVRLAGEKGGVRVWWRYSLSQRLRLITRRPAAKWNQVETRPRPVDSFKQEERKS
jgi:hypothetical protein